MPSLALLQRSCDRLALTHLVISDVDLDGFATFRTPLCRDLMPAFLEGQAAAMERLDDDLLLVGADCVIARHPREGFSGADVAVTIGDFWDCPLNTGAIWVRRHARKQVAAMWRQARETMGEAWGDDQIAIASNFQPLPHFSQVPMQAERSGLNVAFLPVDPWNLAPADRKDDCSHAVVLHFRGNRKDWAPEWCERFLGFTA